MQQADQPGESTQPKKHIFISYGRQDATHVAAWLHQELLALGYEVWLDQHDLQQATGAEWDRKIEDAISQSNVVIALMSPHSVRPQSECRNEISLAKDSDLAIVPVMVNRCDRPLRLHALQYIDLAGFERLSQQARAILLKKVIDAIEHGVSEDPLLASLREKFAPLDFDWMFSRHEKFVGREWLFDQFDRWLQDNSEPVLFLVGPPGIGKSAALSKWIQMRMKIGAVHFCRHDRADLRDPVVMVKSIVTQLLQVQNQLPGFAESIRSINLGSSGKAMDSTGRAAELMDTMVLDPLRKIQPGQCWVLVIDALDEGGEGIQNLLAKVQGHLPPTVKMIVSARPEADVLTLFPNKVVLSALGTENQADLVKYVQQRVDLSKRFAASDEMEKQRIVDGVVSWSEGVFLVAVLVLDEIAAGRLEIKNLSDPIGGLAGFYLQHFRRLFANEETYQDVADCLEVMLVSHEPLSDQFIADVLDRPVRNVTRALNQLGSLVPVQQGTRSPFHKSLFDWLRASKETPHTYALPVDGGLDRIEKWCERVKTADSCDFAARCHSMPKKQEALFQRAVDINVQEMGPSDPKTARSMDFLAKFYSDQRNYQKFEEWILKAYIIYESTFLRDGTCRDNVGFYLNVILQRIHYKNKYSDRLTDEEVFRHSINSGIGLGEINEAGDPSSGPALNLFDLLSAREIIFGSDHLVIAVTAQSIASFCFHQGNLDAAESLYKKVITIYDKAAVAVLPLQDGTFNSYDLIHERGNLFIANIQGKLFDAYRAECNYEKAIYWGEAQLSSLEDQRDNLEPRIGDIVECMFQIQDVYISLKNYPRAKLFALRNLKNLEGVNDGINARYLNRQANIFSIMDDFENAEQLLVKALVFREGFQGVEHWGVVKYIIDLGLLYVKKKDYKKAEAQFSRSLAICEKVLSPNNPDIINCLIHLGNLYACQLDWVKAEPLYERAQKVTIENFRNSFFISKDSAVDAGLTFRNKLEKLAICQENLFKVNASTATRALIDFEISSACERAHKLACERERIQKAEEERKARLTDAEIRAEHIIFIPGRTFGINYPESKST